MFSRPRFNENPNRPRHAEASLFRNSPSFLVVENDEVDVSLNGKRKGLPLSVPQFFGKAVQRRIRRLLDWNVLPVSPLPNGLGVRLLPGVHFVEHGFRNFHRRVQRRQQL